MNNTKPYDLGDCTQGSNMKISKKWRRTWLHSFAFPLFVLLPGQASASIILTFSLSGVAVTEPESILSYSTGPTWFMVKEIDALSPIIIGIVARGDHVSAARFIVFNDEGLNLVDGRYDFTDLIFTSYSSAGCCGPPFLDRFSFIPATVTFTPGGPSSSPVPEPTSVPEPNFGVLMIAGVIVIIAQRAWLPSRSRAR